MKANETVWFEFVESKIFSRRIREMPAEILANIQSDLVQNPERGDIVKGTHGVRKARVADPGSSRGKSGSYRYLYLYLEHAGRIYLLYLFSKGEQADLSPEQRRTIAALSQHIRRERES
jgi:mRNA-degrading endonuclease RelE of RelBE toxin-antitoxin system